MSDRKVPMDPVELANFTREAHLAVEKSKPSAPLQEISDASDSDVGKLEKNGSSDITEEQPPPEKIETTIANLPIWYKLITGRGLLVGIILGGVFCIITHRLNLGAGVIPSLNIPAGLLAFLFLRCFDLFCTRVLKLRIDPFTRQENNVVQTFITACYSVAFTGGFGMYLIALSKQTYLDMGGASTPGNSLKDVWEPSLGRTIPYLLVTSIVGIFILVAVRKLLILDYNLPFPSGTATGIMINSFHTPLGEANAKKQLVSLGKSFAVSIGWDFFKWFWSATNCGFCISNTTYTCGGFGSYPTFGDRAANWSWYFDFSLNYVGSGMICPHIVNWSMMLGAIITWGILWPQIKLKEGDWYPAGLESNSFAGLFGYKVFITIALFMGDGIYQFIKIFSVSAHHWYKMYKASKQPTGEAVEDKGMVGYMIEYKESPADKVLRRAVFMRDRIPLWVGLVGYMAFAVLSVIVVPFLYKPVKWYYVLVAYVIGPFFALPNAYGCGLTDWDMSSTYGKLAIFIFAAWCGANGGVTAGLVVCGVVLAAASTAATIMQDFRTGYLTLSPPKAMFCSQVLGSLAGAIIAPITFQMFWSTGEIANPAYNTYPAPYATIYRGMAIFGTQGTSMLPKYCWQLMLGFFLAAIVINILRDFVVPKKYAGYVPIPMAMAIPFYIGAYLAVDMCIGSSILWVWERVNPESAALLAPAVASGLIVGDGIWAIPQSILGATNVNPPMCMGWGRAPSDPQVTSSRRHLLSAVTSFMLGHAPYK